MLLRATWRMFVSELRLFLREPIAVFFTIAFPLLLILIIGSVYGSLDLENGYRYIDLYVPGLLGMVIANLALMGIPITLAEYREQGILQRYQVTPLPVGSVFVAHILVGACMFFLSALLLLIVAVAVYQVRFGGNVLLVLSAILLSIAALFAMGFAIGGLTTTARTTQAVGSVFFFVMFFGSGAAFPREDFPAWMQAVTRFFPLTHIVELLGGLWIGKAITDLTSSLVVLAATFAISAVLASRTFRWRA